jgi:integrase
MLIRVRVKGLELRDGVWKYRRTTPPHLLPIIKKRQVIRSLNTDDRTTAVRRLPAAKAEVERIFAEAEAALKNRAAGEYKTREAIRASVAKALQDDAADRLRRPRVESEPPDEGESIGTAGDEEAEYMALTSALEKLEEKAEAGGEAETRRAILRALLNKLNGHAPETTTAEDSPPLSIVFDRFKAERRPSAKTWREFDRALRGFVDAVGDLPVRAIHKEHVRAYKQALLNGISKRDGKSPVKVATVQKLLNVVRAVFEWANREGIVESNVAHGVSRVAALSSKADTGDERRMPFTVEQARTIIAKLPTDGPVRWLYLMGLYSGARLSELSGLRREDVREVDGVLCFDIRPHDGRSLKNKSSRRLVPVHPQLLAAGFNADLLPFKGTGHYHSKRVNEWLRNVAKITDSAVSFHSARHLVKDRLRAARVPEQEQRALMGHASNSVADGYGVGFPVSILAEAIGRVRY